MSEQMSPWRNRIVDHAEVHPASLKANPANWRTHPVAQARGLSAVLAEVGIVQGVIVNRTTGHLLDGHLRVEAAIGSGQSLVPVTYVELSEDEERIILATFDSLGDMAGLDVEALRGLHEVVLAGQAPGSALAELIMSLGEILNPVVEPACDLSSESQLDGFEYRVIIDCTSEGDQIALIQQLEAEGRTCRPLIS